DPRHLEAHAARTPLRAALHRAGAARGGDRRRAAGAHRRARRRGQGRGGTPLHGDARRRGGRLPNGHHGLARAVRRGRVAPQRVPHPDEVIEPFTVLAEDDDLPRWDVPAEIERLYGAVGLADECVIANFVESLDGVVAIPGLPRSHAVVSDDSEADRFVLALLRACADVVLVGAATLAASPTGTWRVDKAYPQAAEAFAELRAARRLSEQPRVAVVTSGSSFVPSHPVLNAGALVLTTE